MLVGGSQLSGKCFIEMKFPNGFLHPCLLVLLLYLDPSLILLKISNGDTKYRLELYFILVLCPRSQGSNKFSC